MSRCSRLAAQQQVCQPQRRCVPVPSVSACAAPLWQVHRECLDEAVQTTVSRKVTHKVPHYVLDAVQAEVAECLSLRISDILEYSPTANAFIQQIGAHNVATLKEMSELYLYDFGIFIELSPDEEEKAMLENNIQMAIQQRIIQLRIH